MIDVDHPLFLYRVKGVNQTGILKCFFFRRVLTGGKHCVHGGQCYFARFRVALAQAAG